MTNNIRRFTKKYSLQLWSQLWTQTPISDTPIGQIGTAVPYCVPEKVSFQKHIKLTKLKTLIRCTQYNHDTIRPYGLWSPTLISCYTSLFIGGIPYKIWIFTCSISWHILKNFLELELKVKVPFSLVPNSGNWDLNPAQLNPANPKAPINIDIIIIRPDLCNFFSEYLH